MGAWGSVCEGLPRAARRETVRSSRAPAAWWDGLEYQCRVAPRCGRPAPPYRQGLPALAVRSHLAPMPPRPGRRPARGGRGGRHSLPPWNTGDARRPRGGTGPGRGRELGAGSGPTTSRSFHHPCHPPRRPADRAGGSLSRTLASGRLPTRLRRRRASGLRAVASGRSALASRARGPHLDEIDRAGTLPQLPLVRAAAPG